MLTIYELRDYLEEFIEEKKRSKKYHKCYDEKANH